LTVIGAPNPSSIPPGLNLAISTEVMHQFKEGYACDPKFKDVWARTNPLTTGRSALISDNNLEQFHRFTQGNDRLLLFKDTDNQSWLCIPRDRQPGLIKEAHDSPHEAAHGWWGKTLELLRQGYYWKSMHKDVISYCEMCNVCKKTKHDQLGPKSYLSPIDVPQLPFEVISMDFVTGLPESGGFNAILVVVDKLTKYGLFIPMTTRVTADKVTALLHREVYKHFSLPKHIVSDCNPCFISNFWHALAHYFNTRLAMSTSHHPQTDRQTEIMNQHLETMLQCYMNVDCTDWANWLDILASAYNRAVHSSTLVPPAELLLGYMPWTLLHLLREQAGPLSTASPLANNHISTLKVCRDLARDAIMKAANIQAYHYDKKRRAILYKVGDKVLINPHSLELVDVKGVGHKLMQQWIGPFEIMEVLSPTMYQLWLYAHA
jgi:Integrase zinc binding domain/Integrase core domain